jgi:hypothetical protein
MMLSGTSSDLDLLLRIGLVYRMGAICQSRNNCCAIASFRQGLER